MDQYFYEKPFWSCAATNNMPVGVGSGRQESPLAEGRNYIFVTFFFPPQHCTRHSWRHHEACWLVDGDVVSVRKDF